MHDTTVIPGAVFAHLEYLEQLGRKPATTIYARARALARMAAVLPAPLLDASAADLMAWRAGLDLGPDAVANYVSHAREFYAWAVSEGLIDSSPAVRLPAPRRRRRLPRPVSERDLFAALAGAPPRIRPWLVLAGWCGLRACEIAWLRRECVLDTAAPPVLIVAADATKGRTERAVPMSGYVTGELLRAGLPASGWMFPRLDGGRGPNTPARVSHLASRYLHGCGIQATLHQFRHRFGTETYRIRKDLRMVQELMGHADPATTAGYAAVVQADAAAVVEQLPAPGRLRAVTG